MKATNKFLPVAGELILNSAPHTKNRCHFPSEKTAELKLKGHPKIVATFSFASLLLSEPDCFKNKGVHKLINVKT